MTGTSLVFLCTGDGDKLCATLQVGLKNVVFNPASLNANSEGKLQVLFEKETLVETGCGRSVWMEFCVLQLGLEPESARGNLEDFKAWCPSMALAGVCRACALAVAVVLNPQSEDQSFN